MKTLNVAITLAFMLLASLSFAQNNAEQQKVYTYEQAVELLTSHEKEFQTKNGVFTKSILPEIGKQIKAARSKHNISLPTLSFVTGLEEKDLERIEKGEVVPTRDIIITIQDFLGEEIVLADEAGSK